MKSWLCEEVEMAIHNMRITDAETSGLRCTQMRDDDGFLHFDYKEAPPPPPQAGPPPEAHLKVGA